MTQPLKPLRIGPVRIDFPVVLAPLAGYSDLPFRRICRQCGAGYCATEMLLDRSLLVHGKLQRRLLALSDDDHPIAGQLIGNDPPEMAEAARLLEQMNFDVVDVNFACPVKKALSRRRGGYLMKEPALAREIIGAIVEAVSLPVTIKLRCGFANEDAGGEAFWRIAESAFELGAAAICVHGRTVEAKYVGPADWGILAEVKRTFPDRTVLGSGDARSPRAALDMMARTGVDGVSAARGALGNPWFFRQTADLAAGREPYRPPLEEQRDVLRWQFDEAVKLYGPRRGPNMMRKFGIKYARLHPEPKRLRTAFVEVKTPDQWHAVLDAFYPP